MIADAQVHLWVSGWDPALPYTVAHRQRAVFSAEDALTEMAEAGVDRVVIVPPNWENNEHAIAAARRYPDRFAAMGRLALDRPESRSLIAGWKARGMHGLRMVFNRDTQPWLTDGTADWIWPAAERAGLPVMIYVPGGVAAVAGIAERHPGLRLVLDHLAIPVGAKGPEAFWHIPLLAALARYPNVAVKASGLPSNSNEVYPFRDVDPTLRRVFDAFGPTRVFWGTDLTRMPCSWRQCVTHFTEELPWLTQGDKALVMGIALCEWIDWKLPAGAGGSGGKS